jgi:alpha-galactosidase
MNFIFISFFIISIVCLDNGVALTPPMGWNSWNYFRCGISEDLIKQTADILV